MNFVWYLLISLASGVFAGMGMGGGTFLIPLLTILMGVETKIAQCINLLVFIPMAVVTIIIYSKKKMIDYKNWWIISIPAAIVSSVAALFSVSISGLVMKIIFGGFISLIGVIQIIVIIKKKVTQKS